MKKQITIGLDLDNTIICYDKAIEILSSQIEDLPDEVSRTKLGIRTFLRSVGRENDWVLFQGLMYGPGMIHASPYPGCLSMLRELEADSHKLCIISHRSKHPYAGPKYDLHQSAKQWIIDNLNCLKSFSDKHAEMNINFLQTKQEKVELIWKLGCNVFIDDLPEVLNFQGFRREVDKILFSPFGESDAHSLKTISSWNELNNWI